MHVLEHARRHRAVPVVGDQDRVGASGQRREPLHQRVLGGWHELGRGLAIEADDLLAGRRVAAGHDPGLHRRHAPGLDDEAMGGDSGALEEGEQRLAGAVASDHADGNDPRPQRGDVMGGVGGPTQPHVTLGELEDDDRRLA